jgi:hypothetical protein
LTKKIESYIKEWKQLLGLNEWRIEANYKTLASEKGPDCEAMINPSWEYQSAVLTVYLPTIFDSTDRELEYIIVHELVHCLVQPMVVEGETRTCDVENVVVSTSKAFLRVKYLKNKSRKK